MSTYSEGPKIGIVGLELQANEYLRALKELECDIHATDIRDEAISDRADTFDTTIHETPDDLYAAGVDGVIIATPTKYHEDFAVKALERDIPVLIEKPLAHTVESAERIVTAADEAEVPCLTHYHDRFHPLTRILKDRADRGELGEVSHIEARIVRKRGIPGRETWYTTKEVAGGGALIDMGVIALDTLMYLLSFPELDEVLGVTRSEFGPRDDYASLNAYYGHDIGVVRCDVEDSVTAMLRFENDVTAAVDIRWAANNERKRHYRFFGTDAGGVLDLRNDELETHSVESEPTDHVVEQRITAPETKPITKQAEEFLDVVRGNGPTTSTEIGESLRIQRLVDAIYESSE